MLTKPELFEQAKNERINALKAINTADNSEKISDADALDFINAVFANKVKLPNVDPRAAVTRAVKKIIDYCNYDYDELRATINELSRRENEERQTILKDQSNGESEGYCEVTKV